MDENQAQDHLSTTRIAEHGCSEKISNLLEEPDQRWRERKAVGLPRLEKIRLVMLSVALLALLIGFLCFLFARTTLPLFGTMIVAFVGYRGLDAWLNRAERPRD